MGEGSGVEEEDIYLGLNFGVCYNGWVIIKGSLILNKFVLMEDRVCFKFVV